MNSDYYTKEFEGKNIFYVNRNIFLTEEILKEMTKYNIIEFCKTFNQPIDNLPSEIQSITFNKY